VDDDEDPPSIGAGVRVVDGIQSTVGQSAVSSVVVLGASSDK
jgi:hypothetical protein